MRKEILGLMIGGVMTIASCWTATAVTRPALETRPVGFGAKDLNADGTGYGIPVCNGGTLTAPEGWTIKTCSSLSDINSNLKSNTIVMVTEGTYGSGAQSTSSDKDLTINGLSNVSVIGMGNVVFKKIIIKGTCKNVLIRNVSVKGFAYDGVPVTASGTVWLDHCTIGDDKTSTNKEKPDGAMDIYSNSSLYMTISWCKIQNHWKTMLHGKDDKDNGSGSRHITHYCNYYYNTHQRTPRIRGGQTHILNCMYENSGFGRTYNTTSKEYDMASMMIYKDDGEYLKNRRVVSDGYSIMATNNSDVVVDSCFFYDVRWPIVCSRPCNEFTAKYGDLQSPDICNGCVASRTANGGTNHCRQTGNGYYDMGLPTEIKVKAADVSCPDGNCETIKVELGYGFTDADGNQRYIINPQMLNPGGRSIKFDEYDGGNAFKPGDIGYYYPKDYVKRTNAEVREVVPIYAGADTYDMTCTDVAPTLAYTGELNQDLNKTGVETIEDIVFTWGGGATDVSVTGIPTANMTKNTANKTLTISGKVNSLMAYTVTTKGGSGEAVSFSGTIYPIGYSASCGKMARIETTIGTAGTYEVNIYDASDKVMQTVYSGSMGTGTMSLIFAATDIDGGTYTWKLVNKADNKVAQTGTVEIP